MLIFSLLKKDNFSWVKNKEFKRKRWRFYHHGNTIFKNHRMEELTFFCNHRSNVWTGSFIFQILSQCKNRIKLRVPLVQICLCYLLRIRIWFLGTKNRIYLTLSVLLIHKTKHLCLQRQMAASSLFTTLELSQYYSTALKCKSILNYKWKSRCGS